MNAIGGSLPCLIKTSSSLLIHSFWLIFKRMIKPGLLCSTLLRAYSKLCDRNLSSDSLLNGIQAVLIGSFSIDSSEDVTFKLNLRFFRQCRVYSKRMRIFLELCSAVPPSSLAREGIIRRRLFTSYIKRAIKHFHVLLVQ